MDLVHIVNGSLLSGIFPASLKTAVVRPLLKQRNLDASILNNYRHILNLPLPSKIIEKVIFNQIINHFLQTNDILNSFQLGFLPHYSTDTALIKNLNDICLTNVLGNLTALVLLDLS